MRSLIFALLLSILWFPKVFAECSLVRPGPFLKQSKNKTYSKKESEDSSEERLSLSSNKTLLVNTYGCEDNWGWDITLELSGNAEKAKSLESALTLIQNLLPEFQEKKKSEYQIKENFKKFIEKIDKSKFKKEGANQAETVCARMSTLSPKECALTLRLELKSESKKQSLHFEFRDMEN